MNRSGAVVALALLAAACITPAPSSAPPETAALLAPTGKLRAAINFGNLVLASRDPAGGQPRGVSVAVAPPAPR